MIPLCTDCFHEPRCQGPNIIAIIHLVNNLLPIRFLDVTVVLNLFAHLHDLPFALQVILLSKKDLQKITERLLDMHLNESEVFIAFVFEDLCEERDLVVVP